MRARDRPQPVQVLAPVVDPAVHDLGRQGVRPVRLQMYGSAVGMLARDRKEERVKQK